MLNLDDEVRLFAGNAERERWDNLAGLYSIVVTLDHLERAYVRDTIPHTEYTPVCARLLSQYKTLFKLVEDSIPSLEAFLSEYRVASPAVVHRLKVGVPATVEHSMSEGVDMAKAIAETTQYFITFMDALKLNMRAKDQLHPLLSELMKAYSNLPRHHEWEGRPKILQWLITLNQMRASDVITEDQCRQMQFDLEAAYNEFFSSLSSQAPK